MAKKPARGRNVNGILLLDKPLGLSSNKALQRAKYRFQANKAGHTGSLDPLASGMLPLCFGEATKVSAFLLDSDKQYITRAHLGITTSTGDLEGEVSSESVVPDFSEKNILEVLARFTGPIDQIPPMHSALKKDGKPLYKLARKGREVERLARKVTIRSLELMDIEGDMLTLKVDCSKGTYIRTLVEDIGSALGCGAHVNMLHRTEVQPFAGFKVYSLEYLAEQAEKSMDLLDSCLLPVDLALEQFERLDISSEQEDWFRAGRIMAVSDAPKFPEDQTLRIYGPGNHFVGLGAFNKECELKPKRVFNLY